MKYYRKDYKQVLKKKKNQTNPTFCLILNNSKQFIIDFSPFRRKNNKVAVALIF